MVAVRGCVSLTAAFLFLSCSIFFLAVAGVAVLVVGVFLGACVRGSASAGSGLVVVLPVLWLCYSWGDETLFFMFSFHGNSPQPGLVEGFTVSGGCYTCV